MNVVLFSNLALRFSRQLPARAYSRRSIRVASALTTDGRDGKAVES